MSDLCYLLAFAQWETRKAGAEPDPSSFESDPLAALYGWLDGADGPPRCLLLLDEYEILAELSAADRWAFLGFLERAPTRYPWLTLALVGLHNGAGARVMGCQIPIGWREIRVGRLLPAEFAAGLSANSRVPFLDSAIAYAYALTGGQPFLGQLLGATLFEWVYRNSTPLVLPITPAVLAIVADTAFFQMGAAHFSSRSGRSLASTHRDNGYCWRRWPVRVRLWMPALPT